MIKELSIDNWILAGTGFLVIFAVGCFFWFQNVMAQLHPQIDDHNIQSQQLEKPINTQKMEVKNTSHQDTTEEYSSGLDITSNLNKTQQKNTLNVERQQSMRGSLQLRILL